MEIPSTQGGEGPPRQAAADGGAQSGGCRVSVVTVLQAEGGGYRADLRILVSGRTEPCWRGFRSDEVEAANLWLANLGIEPAELLAAVACQMMQTARDCRNSNDREVRLATLRQFLEGSIPSA